MLKNRLIPCIIVKGELLVQSFFFKKYLPIGKIKTAIEFFVNWDVDEIVILDIDATKESRSPLLEVIEHAARDCFVPLSIGGGIRSVDDINNLLKVGADKVCINTIAVEHPEFISEAAEQFGSQCVTVSIDAKEVSENRYEVMIRNGKQATGLYLPDWAGTVERLGAGEILINSIDRDGSRKGYDINLLRTVSSAVHVPVIACGGVGKMEHFSAGIIEGGCQAVAASNIFQHTEHSTIVAKSFLKRAGVSARLNSLVRYEDVGVNHI